MSFKYHTTAEVAQENKSMQAQGTYKVSWDGWLWKRVEGGTWRRVTKLTGRQVADLNDCVRWEIAVNRKEAS